MTLTRKILVTGTRLVNFEDEKTQKPILGTSVYYLGDTTHAPQDGVKGCTPEKLWLNPDVYDRLSVPCVALIQQEIDITGKRKPKTTGIRFFADADLIIPDTEEDTSIPPWEN